MNRYYKLTQRVTVGAGAVVTETVTIPDDKGNAVAFDLLPVSVTVADLADLRVSAYANGNQFLEDVTGLEYSSVYQRQDTKTPINIMPKSTLRVTADNQSANSQDYFFIVYLEK